MLTTICILPIEILSNFIYLAAVAVTNALPLDNPDALASANFIGFIVNPVCNLFIVLNGTALNLLSAGDKTINKVALTCCVEANVTYLANQTISNNATSTNSDSTAYMLVNETRTICVQECEQLLLFVMCLKYFLCVNYNNR